MTWNDEPHVPKQIPVADTQYERVSRAVETLEAHVSDDTVFLWTGGKEANVIADLLLYAVGEAGEQPVPFVTIDTGNHFDEMYDFREEYAELTGDRGADTIGPTFGLDDWRVERYDALIDVVSDDSDPRGYHGRWDSGEGLPDSDPLQLPRSPDEWTVADSCGALKTVPMKRVIDDGYSTLITGVRGDDPIPGASGEVERVAERREPAPHTRVNPLVDWCSENVWAYVKKESVSLPDLYHDGFQHTDSECCTSDEQVGEHEAEARDPEKREQRKKLEAMGYV
jgi:3'-phosphoadenosine 5'-phosphosulfate sulfotransferase (PAPS reductase)/FAD synthetase